MRHSTALELINMYRSEFPCLHDGSHGRAATMLAGVLSALPLTNRKLKDHQILIVGEGAMVSTTAEMFAAAISLETGETVIDIRKNVWIVDSKGLVVRERSDRATIEERKLPFMHLGTLCTDLESAVEYLKPTILVGCSFTSSPPFKFTRKICQALAAHSNRPIIFPLSPSGPEYGRGIVANVEGSNDSALINNGTQFVPRQCHTTYIFPGIALGTLMSRSNSLRFEQFIAAAQAVSKLVTDEERKRGWIYPPLSRTREVAAHVAQAVAQKSYEQGTATNLPKPQSLLNYATEYMYRPNVIKPPLLKFNFFTRDYHMSSSTASIQGVNGSESSQLASWEALSRSPRIEVAVRRPVMDLSPTRSFRQEFRRSISFNSWKGLPFECPSTVREGDLPRTQRSSEDANNDENEVPELRETHLEALHKQAMLHDSSLVLSSRKQTEKDLFNEPCFEASIDEQIKGKVPSKKFLDLILLHQGDLDTHVETPEARPMCDSPDARPMCDSPDSIQKLHSRRQPLDTCTVDSAEQYGAEMWSQMNVDFDRNSIASEESKISRARQWSIEPLDSFTDGTKSKAKQLRSIGKKQKCLKENIKTKSSTKNKKMKGSHISYRKISDPSKRQPVETKIHTEPTIRQRLCKGLFSASKQVLQSVWTWAIVTVVFAGVHMHSNRVMRFDKECWTDAEEEDEEEEETYDFEWDDDVEFDLGLSDGEE
eukprot:g4352.t1